MANKKVNTAANIGPLPKTLSDISKVLDTEQPGTARGLSKYFKDVLGKDANVTNAEIRAKLNELKKVYKLEEDRLEVYKTLLGIIKVYNKEEVFLAKELEKRIKKEKAILDKNKEIAEQQKKSKELSKQQADTIRKDVGAALDTIIKKNKEIYEISHELQLQGNMTWKQYTQLFDQAYQTTRDMNKELGKQLFTTSEIVKAQNAMVSAGWRNIDTAQLTSLSAQAALLTRTLGQFPIELQHAFQMSFRQFGSQTDMFVNAMGNRLNTFSNTFGITVNMLSQTVSSLMASNTFIARNNMNAQIMANQSLMQAVALSTQVGINSPSFLTGLSNTAQFGTASQMASMYQAGAYLKDFSTSKFQDMLMNQDYYGATQNLIGSIGSTLGGMEPGYLRNEYMQRIGQGFGLSQDDILQIMTNGNNLSAYTADIQSKLLDVNTSMEDEIKELRMTVVQQLENWWTSSPASQAIGGILQETGLYGMGGLLKSTNAILLAQLALQTMTGGKTAIANTLSLVTKATGRGALDVAGLSASSLGGGIGSGLGAASKMGSVAGSGLKMGLGGLAVGGLSNYIGSDIIAKNDSAGLSADIAGGGINILGGIAGGAMVGSMFGGPLIGGLVGGTLGLINTLSSIDKRNAKLEEIDSRERAARRQSQVVKTGDPVVDAINNMNQNLSNIISGEFNQSRTTEILLSKSAENKFNKINK